MSQSSKPTAILGASPKPERYAYKVEKMLEKKGHSVHLVSPKAFDSKHPHFTSLTEIKEPIDTVTLYIGPSRQENLIEDLLKLKPKRVIFNPGTENPKLYPELTKNRIQVLEACTLVLLTISDY